MLNKRKNATKLNQKVPQNANIKENTIYDSFMKRFWTRHNENIISLLQNYVFTDTKAQIAVLLNRLREFYSLRKSGELFHPLFLQPNSKQAISHTENM